MSDQLNSPGPGPAEIRGVAVGESEASGARTVLIGIGFMLAGVSLFPVMNAFAKYLTAEFPLWQVAWARFFGHLLLTTAIFWPRRRLSVFRTTHPRGQLLRSTVFFGSNAFFLAALPMVSLATASSIMFTAPAIVTALSVVVLGERVGVWRWSAIAFGMAGALIIIQPGSSGFNVGAVLVLGAAVCYSLYQILTRRLVEHDAADTQIVYTAVVGAIVTCLIVPFVGRLPDTPMQVLAFVMIGCLGAIAHFFVIQALKRATASVVAPFGYAELIGATLLGFLFFGDLPGISTWIGAALIIVSGLLIAYRQAHRRPTGKLSRSLVLDHGPAALIVTGGLLLGIAALFHLLG